MGGSQWRLVTLPPALSAHVVTGSTPKLLQATFQLQPMNGSAWYYLGMAHHTLHRPEKVVSVIRHLHRFDPKLAHRLIVDAGRSDLSHLIGT